MKSRSISGNYSALQSLYVERVARIAEEVFDNGARLPTSDTIIQVVECSMSFYSNE